MTPATGTTVPGSTGPGTTARGRAGPRHPVENSLSVFTLVGGLVACVLGFLAYQDVSGAWTHVGATWLGLIVLVVGLPPAPAAPDPASTGLANTGLAYSAGLPRPGQHRPAGPVPRAPRSLRTRRRNENRHAASLVTWCASDTPSLVTA